MPLLFGWLMDKALGMAGLLVKILAPLLIFVVAVFMIRRAATTAAKLKSTQQTLEAVVVRRQVDRNVRAMPDDALDNGLRRPQDRR